MKTSYLTLELRRALRNPRYLIFTVGMPLVLFLLVGNAYGGQLGGVGAQTWYMINMGIFGAMGATLGIGGRIAAERDAGWNRQLRLTPLPPLGYVLGKVVVAMLLALLSIVLVCLAGLLTGRVHLEAVQWLGLIGAGWLSLIPMAVVGVGIGYLARGDSAQAVNGAVLMVMSMFGGIWFPLDGAPSWLSDIAHALPTFWITQISRAPLTRQWPETTAYLVLAVWALLGARIAARRYRVDAARAA
jgi:ABC-2 type transport system permease protein